jgi:LuxR family transcriptional regulator, maltose regulon positive regulatory protein
MTQSLTESERQLALLVAWGATNKQVAELLELSPKTVEWHLSRIFRKIGVRSRADLSPQLLEADRG